MTPKPIQPWLYRSDQFLRPCYIRYHYKKCTSRATPTTLVRDHTSLIARDSKDWCALIGVVLLAALPANVSLRLRRIYHVIACMPFCESGKWRPVPLPENLSLDEEVFVIRFTCEVSKCTLINWCHHGHFNDGVYIYHRY